MESLSKQELYIGFFVSRAKNEAFVCCENDYAKGVRIQRIGCRKWNIIKHLIAFLQSFHPFIHDTLHGFRTGLASIPDGHGIHVLHEAHGASGALAAAVHEAVVDYFSFCRTCRHVRPARDGVVRHVEEVNACFDLARTGHADVWAVGHARRAHHHLLEAVTL